MDTFLPPIEKPQNLMMKLVLFHSPPVWQSADTFKSIFCPYAAAVSFSLMQNGRRWIM